MTATGRACSVTRKSAAMRDCWAVPSSQQLILIYSSRLHIADALPNGLSVTVQPSCCTIATAAGSGGLSRSMGQEPLE